MKPTTRSAAKRRPPLSPAARAAALEARDNLEASARQLVPELERALGKLSGDPAAWSKELATLVRTGKLGSARAKEAHDQLQQLATETISRLDELERLAATELPERSREHLEVLTVAAGLTAARMSELKLTSLADLSNDKLTELVAKKRLSAPEARKLGLAATLYELFDQRAELAAPLLTHGLDELLALDQAQWARLVKSDAAELRARLDALMPTRAFRARLRPASPALLTQALGRVDPLLRKGEKLAQLTSDLPEVQLLQPQARRYPGLELDSVLEDAKKPAAERVAEAARRVKGLEDLFEVHSDKELLRLNLSVGNAELNQKLFGRQQLDVDQQRSLRALRAYQRAWALAKDSEGALALLDGGFTSAAALAAHPFEQVQAKLGPKTRALYEEARLSLSSVTLSAGAMLDHWKSIARAWPVSNPDAGVDAMLGQLDGFATYFGSQSYCDCEHCQSVLSPAAYLVDLLHFVEEHVRKPTFASRPNHALDLKTRRPDLWSLPLSCENTNEQLPTLELANAILEGAVAKRSGFTGVLTDRVSVERHVYETALPTLSDALSQPASLPLERAEVFLGQLGESRASLLETWGANAATLAAARFKLSEAEYRLITQPNTSLPFLNRLFGVTFVASGSGLAPVDAQALLPRTALTRAQLQSLVDSRFVNEGLSAPVHIVASRASQASVQNDVERLTGLTAAALDRLHRLARLARKTDATIAELDLLLTHLQDATLSGVTLERLGAIFQIKTLLGSSVEETAALFGPLPRVGLDGDPSLFDRAFNSTPFVPREATWPVAGLRFLHPALRLPGSTTQPDPSLARLLTGLRVSDDLLLQLIVALQSSLGVTVDHATEAGRSFELTSSNLALLFRHARLAALLELAPRALGQLLRLVPGLTQARVDSLPDLEAVLDFHGWWRASGFSLDELSFVTGGRVSEPERLPDADAVATQVLSRVTDAEQLFADTIFAGALGLTEDASRRVIAANASRLERVEERWRLAAGFDPAAALVVPAGVQATEPELREVLLAHHVSVVLPRALAGALGLSPDRATALFRLSGQSFGAAGLDLALRGGARAPLVAVIRTLLPLTIALKSSAFDTRVIELVRASPASFGITNVLALTPQQVRELSVVRALMGETAARYADEPELSSEDLATGLINWGQTGFTASADAALARVLRTTPQTISALRARVPSAATAALSLLRLAAVVRTSIRLGLPAETFSWLSSTATPDHARAADAARAAFISTIEGEQEQQVKLEPLEDQLRSRRRDALCDALLFSFAPAFKDREALYAWFLIDVQLEGCARTSRVVSAISSVQLYVQRVLLHLEKDDLPLFNPQHVACSLSADARAEWTWRKNYRVWEANRKVFLFPENYIEPSLRDDKTELFKQLEASLLQQEINEQTVVDAYAQYLRGFHELSTLSIAGAYQDLEGDVLHLFGATAEDPPTYYYRTAENLARARSDENQGVTWTGWRKLNVQINARRVAPVIAQGRLYLFWANYKTSSLNTLVDGDSRFQGYEHQLSLKYTALRLDGTWTAPQDLALPPPGVFPFSKRGKVRDLLTSHVPKYDIRAHLEPQDDYTLTGAPWLELYAEPTPRGVSLVGRNFYAQLDVDLFARTTQSVYWPPRRYTRNMSVFSATSVGLYRSRPLNWYLHPSGFAGLVLEQSRLASAEADYGATWIQRIEQGLYVQPLSTLPDDAVLTVVAGNPRNVILQTGADVLLLEGPGEEAGTQARRIGTTLAEELQRTLFNSGVDGLLNIARQLFLTEAPLPLTVHNHAIDDLCKEGIDFRGPYGSHFREIYFHIPALIANTLNSQGHYEAAQRWYHTLFDPTANPVLWTLSLPPVPIDAKDRVWRYLEFRNLGIPKLRDTLTDPAALAVYRKDPFNPHAIARLRLSAYQKNVVMKYVDNLLDWADELFTQFTTESLNEATALYVLAGQILGPRPPQLGACETGAPKTYEQLAPLLGPDSELLAELETWLHGSWLDKLKWQQASSQYAASPEQVHAATETTRARKARRDTAERSTEKRKVPEGAQASRQEDGPTETFAPGEGARFEADGWSRVRNTGWSQPKASSRKGQQVERGLAPQASALLGHEHKVASTWQWDLIRQVNALFCVPVNKELLELWSRLEQRLFNLRHCRDIDGVRRLPALFAPEIDPRLLVKAKAAGLSLEEVMNLTSGALPPYRFTFLIEKARSWAQTAQSFGTALYGAIERRDADELNRLRLVQQQHLAQLTTQLRRWEIEVATETLEATRRQRESAEYRRDRQDTLMAEDLTPWERTQQVARHASSVLHGVGATLGILGGVFSLVPELGSPFAMKYGGVALGGAASRFASATITLANMSDTLASSAGLEAGFERRRREWATARELAVREVKSLERQEKAAMLRVELAQRALELHEKSLEQLDETFEYFSSRFTTAELFSWLASTLGKNYRSAWANALAMAGLAEQAYRFERGEEPPPMVGASAWDTRRAGLLAGEQLLLDLQVLERRFLETNTRALELDQPLSLANLSPGALLQLKETGECEFDVPELAFDLVYPGHYRRRIRAVRVTIPSVTGPYTNVSATLTLTRSWLRKEPRLGAANLIEEPVRRTVSIATSTAQNDAGVFELSFRDERYMPFEGAGAVSRWKLTLPRSFRQFDYQTISDVILSVSYTALEDGALRSAVETLNAATEGTVLNVLSTHGGARVLSLRNEYSGTFNRLLQSPPGTQVPLELGERIFPGFLRGQQGRTITIRTLKLAAKTKAGIAVGSFAVSVDGATVTGFTADAALGGLAAREAPAQLRANLLGTHTLKVEGGGGLAGGAGAALDDTKLLDLLLYLEFTVT